VIPALIFLSVHALVCYGAIFHLFRALREAEAALLKAERPEIAQLIRPKPVEEPEPVQKLVWH
jgi:hypothetical protein